jgi:hypothetical protein
MKLLIPLDELHLHKILPCECKTCKRTFHISKSLAKRVIKGTKKSDYCSTKCANLGKITRIKVCCKNCGNEFLKKKSQFRGNNNFCNNSCAGHYNNKNKVTGYRRSKIEKWIESNLSKIYPHLEIFYSDKKAIKSELDIYIPSLNLAFEINGIIHYTPIYGCDKLYKIQEKDREKVSECIKNKITLYVIDVSSQKYFTIKNSQKYLDIILKAINIKLEPYKISQSSRIVTKDD